MRAFMRLCPSDSRPEVDHIVGIAIGGQSIGLENVQVLCRQCHKAKTKIDGRERIALKGNKRKGVKFTQAHCEALSKVRKGFDSEARKAHRPKLYADMEIAVFAINNKTGDVLMFKSIKACADALGLNATCISRVLSGERKKHKGYSFKKDLP